MTELVHSSEFFVFDFRHAVGGEAKRVAVAFCIGQFDEGRFVERVRRHFDHRLSPDHLVLLGEPRLRSSLLAAASSDLVAGNLPAATRYVRTPAVIPMSFDSRGSLEALDPAGPGLGGPEEFGKALKTFGLRHIFASRNGVLDAGAGRHFVKPSQKHSQHFIRTANVLLYSAEVGFIAFALLKHLPNGVRQILTDTASINAVAYALSDLRRSIDPLEPVPTVNSFSSYAGLDAFRAEGEDDTLCLVSASTSGDLEENLTKKLRLPRERVVTLFFCGAAGDASRRALCDVTQRAAGDGGHLAIQSFSERACPLCAQGSTPVRISGDQFLPSDPRVDSVMLTTGKVPSWINKTMPMLVNRRAISCHHRRSGTTGRIRQIHLRIAEVLIGTKFQDRLHRALQTAVPAALKAVIHLPDESSHKMAELAGQYFASEAGRALPDSATITSDKFTRNPDQIAVGTGSVLVVASTTVTGRSLLGVSQLLRQVARDASIVYLVGIARSSTKREWEELCRNLRYGRFADEFPLYALYELTLPDDREAAGSPWAQEKRFLTNLKEQIALGPHNEVANKVLTDRVGQIDDAGQSGRPGLQDDCFLPPWDGTASYGLPGTRYLRLRAGFAFWPFPYDTELVTQADTYATIAGILHHLRSGDGASPYLVQHEHARTVLSPGNFTRFNDGVIQAALLRAATRAELDYSHDERLSAQMREIIHVSLQNIAREEGEAGPEFILALALGKLRLTRPHLAELRDLLRDHELHPFLRLVADEISRGIETD